MRRGRILFILAFVLILGLVAVLVIWQRFQSQEPTTVQVTPESTLVNVVAVTQRVQRGEVLTDEVLGTIPWDKTAVISETMFTEASLPELAGRQARYDLEAGVPLFRHMLVEPDEQLPEAGSVAAMSIPRGMVAVSIPVNRLSSVAYALRPGDHVDVIVTMLFLDVDTDFQTALPNYSGVVIAAGPPDPETGEQNPLTVGITSLLPGLPYDPETQQTDNPVIRGPGIAGKAEIDPVLGQSVYLVPSEDQRPRMASQILLQDVIVLQVGNFTVAGQKEAEEAAAQQPQQQVEGQQDGEEVKIVTPDVVTLIVTPQDAVTLNYLMFSTASQLNLALRSAGDDTRVDTSLTAVTLQFLLEQYQIPVPIKLPYGLNPRIDQLAPPVLLNDIDDTKK